MIYKPVILSPHPIFHDTETPLSWGSFTHPGPAVNTTTSFKLKAVFSPLPGIQRSWSTWVSVQSETLFSSSTRFEPDNFLEFKSNTRVATMTGAWLAQSRGDWDVFLLGCDKVFVDIILKWFKSSSYSTTSIVRKLIVSAVLFVESIKTSSRIVCKPLSWYDGTPSKRCLAPSNSSQVGRFSLSGAWN